MIQRATKTYGHELGLSCAFRQHRAASHCRFLHGYALAVRLEFEAADLDENGWVLDFGGLQPVRAWLVGHFDHRTLIAEDDPALPAFRSLHEAGVIDLNVVDAIGCEAFSLQVFEQVRAWLVRAGHAPRVRLLSAEVREHGANSAATLAL